MSRDNTSFRSRLFWRVVDALITGAILFITVPALVFVWTFAQGVWAAVLTGVLARVWGG